MIIRPALITDLPAVDAMRKADGNALGFLPLQRYEYVVTKTKQNGRARWFYEWLLVSTDNGDVTGFVFALFSAAGTKIEQICVRRDARMMERAKALLVSIERESERRLRPLIKCRVAADIEANLFWRALDYRPIATVTSTWLNLRESKSRRPLIYYEKPLCQMQLPL
jgi:hypothetical protein